MTSLSPVVKSSRWSCVKDAQGEVRAQTEPAMGDSVGEMEHPAARTKANGQNTGAMAATSPASVSPL